MSEKAYFCLYRWYKHDHPSDASPHPLLLGIKKHLRAWCESRKEITPWTVPQ